MKLGCLSANLSITAITLKLFELKNFLQKFRAQYKKLTKISLEQKFSFPKKWGTPCFFLGGGSLFNLFQEWLLEIFLIF